MNTRHFTAVALLFVAASVNAQTNISVAPEVPGPQVLTADSFKHCITEFNENDNELYAGSVSNSLAWEFLRNNIPFFDCPDQEINEIYYFRWWTYRKHISKTPVGYVITEFLPPVGWAGKYNTIDCAAGHHLHEGRWLSDSKYLDDYSRFWFRNGGEPRRYSFWVAEALWARYQVTGEAGLVRDLLPDLVANYEAWERDKRDSNGLFWQIDDRDGMEISVGGSGYRPTINSYMFGDAMAIANIAKLDGRPDIAARFTSKAAELKQLVQEKLWDPQTQFFKVLPREAHGALSKARELQGYTPWYFDLPDIDQVGAWTQVMDPKGFYAPYGPTTVEQRSRDFRLSYEGHECQWNGPSWPFATSILLSGLANVLNRGDQMVITSSDYFKLLKIYTKSQHLRLGDGREVPWIDENINPTNGDWIARTLLQQRGFQIPERGKDYNHSTYCDLIISGLIGLRPRSDEVLEVNPQVPPDWNYFCLDRVRYHGHWLTIFWDKTGEHYRRGKGFFLLVDGKAIAHKSTPHRVTVALPPVLSRRS